MMVVTVTFALGDAFDATQLGRLAADAAPRFEKIPGLRSKTFTVDAVRREAVNIYQWDDAAAGQAFFTDALREQVTQVYGVSPQIEFLSVVARAEQAPAPRR